MTRVLISSAEQRVVLIFNSKQGLNETDLTAHQVAVGRNQVIALQVFHDNRLLQ